MHFHNMPTSQRVVQPTSSIHSHIHIVPVQSLVICQCLGILHSPVLGLGVASESCGRVVTMWSPYRSGVKTKVKKDKRHRADPVIEEQGLRAPIPSQLEALLHARKQRWKLCCAARYRTCSETSKILLFTIHLIYQCGKVPQTYICSVPFIVTRFSP